MYSACLKLHHKISYSGTSPLHMKMFKSYSQQIKHVGGWWGPSGPWLLAPNTSGLVPTKSTMFVQWCLAGDLETFSLRQ